MSDVFLTAVCTSVPPTIAAMSALFVSLRNSGSIKEVHMIVNNERSVMVRWIAALAKRVARDNPDDAIAQDVAIQTEMEASKLK